MKVKKASAVLFSLLLLITSLQAQDRYVSKLDSVLSSFRIKQATKAFDNLAYAKSIRRFEPLFQQGYLADSLKGQLALAYLKVNNADEAARVYASIGESNLQGNDLFYYAQALKYKGEYAEADRYMARYLVDHQYDSRAQKQINALPAIKKIMAQERYAIEVVDINSSHSDFGAVVAGDKLLFTSAREIDVVIRREYAWKETPYLNVYTVPIRDQRYGAPTLLSGSLKSVYHDGPVCISRDGNELYITRNSFSNLFGKKGVDGTNHLKLMVAKKQSDGNWGKPADLPFNSDGYSSGHAALSANEQRLYFASDREGGYGGSDIWYVDRTSNAWSQPINMGPIVNTEGDEMFPFVDDDNNLYFASNGHLGLGGLDIFVAANVKGSCQVFNMGYPINSPSDDFSLFLCDDGLHGYFASNREGGKGDDDIYRFKVLEALSFTKRFKSRLLNKYTQEVIPHTAVLLRDETGNFMKEFVTDADGWIETELPLEVTNLTLAVHASEYYPYTEQLEVLKEVDEHKMELLPLPVYGIYGHIFLLPDSIPVPEVRLAIEAKTGESATLSSRLDGFFKAKLQADTDYDLVFSKAGYFTKRIQYSTVGRDTSYVNVNEFIQLEMEAVEVGKSIEIEILYDLGKWHIRDDAATGLDDMVRFLKDNPDVKIELGSHTDARGSRSSNQLLSQRRAESAVQYMLDRGIEPGRIRAKGYGETRLKNRCVDGVPCSEAEHQANRRSEVTIIQM